MSAIDQEALDYFGRVLMKEVRDRAIRGMDMTLSGHMKGESAERIRKALRKFSVEDIEALKWLLPQVVDSTIHHMLWTLERYEDIIVTVQVGSELGKSLAEISDGLCGEMEGEDGWIALYSKERDTYRVPEE